MRSYLVARPGIQNFNLALDFEALQLEEVYCKVMTIMCVPACMTSAEHGNDHLLSPFHNLVNIGFGSPCFKRFNVVTPFLHAQLVIRSDVSSAY